MREAAKGGSFPDVGKALAPTPQNSNVPASGLPSPGPAIGHNCRYAGESILNVHPPNVTVHPHALWKPSRLLAEPQQTVPHLPPICKRSPGGSARFVAVVDKT